MIPTDIATSPLSVFAGELHNEGYTVVALAAGDLAKQTLLSELEACGPGGELGVPASTAGDSLSSRLANDPLR